jgi:uncharacterized protein YlaN (UPF0358 family)
MNNMITSFSCLLITAYAIALGQADQAQNNGPASESIKALEVDVVIKEKELLLAKCSLAEARARLAWAKGMKKEASAEWRKVIEIRESELAWITQLEKAGLLEHEDQARNASAQLALAKANLAEVEADLKSYVSELQKVIDYYDFRLQKIDYLRRANAITAEEGRQIERELRRELSKARARQLMKE